jgi:thiamine pyrophosphokinase
MSVPKTSVFDPALFLAGDNIPADVAPPDLLILNQPITNFTLFTRLWKHTDYRICADGGANRLFDMFEGDLEKQRTDFVRSFLSLPHHH